MADFVTTAYLDSKIAKAAAYIKNDIERTLGIPCGIGHTGNTVSTNSEMAHRDNWRAVWIDSDETNKLKIQPDAERQKWPALKWPKSNPIQETIVKCIKESEKKMNTYDFANLKVVIGDKVITPKTIDVKRGDPFVPDQIIIRCEEPAPSTMKYAAYTKMCSNSKPVKGYYANIPEIEKVIFNNPATIVIWADGSKTVVKAQSGDTYNPEVGIVMCIAKKVYGNGNKFNDIIRECFIQKIQADSIMSRRQAKALYKAAVNDNDAKVDEITTTAARTNVNNAYDALTKIFNKKRTTKAEMIEAIEAAIGDLGEALDKG
ncbi:MAG: hypothetical protein J6Q84_07175 [Kiritimatiellae bacterium]|nr:hypothetical protein [Kiritimatiellia bacterium]